MRFTSRSKALAELCKVRDSFRTKIADNYEPRAKPCAACESPGRCCLDRHFVNVRISRLEAAAIREVIDGLGPPRRQTLLARIADAEIYETGKFACPLFEPEIGCVVHREAKPLACIAHACYERKEDLPPDGLLIEHENLVARLDARTHGRAAPPLPIPLALRRTR